MQQLTGILLDLTRK